MEQKLKAKDQKSRQRGFSAVEVLIALLIVGFLTKIVISSFSAFRKQSLLATETQEVVTMLNKARMSSISSLGDDQYGVHLESGKIVFFKGTTYSAGAATNETHLFDPLVALSVITVNGGGSDIVFQKVTGGTTQNATTTMSVTGMSTASSTIIVRGTGIATMK